MVTRRQVLTTAAGVAAVSALQIRPAYADYTMSVNPQSNWGTWEGWGTSLCWWANVYGTQDLLADILFTRNAVTYDGQSLPGLGMNIARYNAGGCTTAPINGDSMVVSPRIPSWKQIQGFWLNWFSADPASSSWNWTVDAPQRAMLAKARDRGANLLELFSNSPLWWMCINHNPSGAATGGDNLQSWNYQQHAVYLATVAKYAHDHWGIDFDSVDAFNEPAADWWRADGTQEGCHVSPSIQAQVIGHLRSELDNRGLTGTAVSASDESLYDQARSTWASFSSTTRAKIARVNVHGYQYEGGRRDLLFNEVSAAGKPLWQSEYGDGDGTGMKMARNLTYDLRWLHPTAWVYWQAFDGLEWGLIFCDENAGTLGQVNPKYFVFAQYSRHIRPGMRILDPGDGNTVAAYDATARRLVLVTANFDTGQWINYDLSRFSAVGGASGGVRRWMTTTDAGGERYVAHPTDTVLDGKRFWSWFPAHTVQTFEIDNVSL